MTHQQMIDAAKIELENQYKTIALAMGISEDAAKTAWLKSARDDYENQMRHYNGQPKNQTMPLEKSAYLIALGEIVKRQTCGNCKNFRLCSMLFQCSPSSSECDFVPSRFQNA